VWEDVFHGHLTTWRFPLAWMDKQNKEHTMKRTRTLRTAFVALLVAGGAASLPAAAQINVTIDIAPPPLIIETRPVTQPGYVYAPGHWAWTGSRFVWISGRVIVQREGYLWVTDRWTPRDGKYYREVGRWERDRDWHPGKSKQNNGKAPKKDGRHDNRDFNPGNSQGKGHRN